MDFYNEQSFIHDAMIKISSALTETSDVAEIISLVNTQMELAEFSCGMKITQESLTNESILALLEKYDSDCENDELDDSDDGEQHFIL